MALNAPATVSVDFLSQACEDSIVPYQQSMLSLIETSNDTSTSAARRNSFVFPLSIHPFLSLHLTHFLRCCSIVDVLTAIVRTVHDLPAVATSLLRSKQAYAHNDLPPNLNRTVTECLACGYSSLLTYRRILLACFTKTASVLNEQIASFSNVSDVSAATCLDEVSQSYTLLHGTLDSLVVWTEAEAEVARTTSSPSSLASWLSATDLACPPFPSPSFHTAAGSDVAAAGSILEHMESMLRAICALLLQLSSQQAGTSTPLVNSSAPLVISLQKCFHKILELFGYFLLFPSTDMATAVYEHYSTLSPCTLDQQHLCAGVLCIFRCVSVVADWLISTGNQKYNLNNKLQTLFNSPHIQVSFGCLKECLFASANNPNVNSQFVKWLQSALCCSGLTLHSSDTDEADRANDDDDDDDDDDDNDDGIVNDELGFTFIFLAEVISQLLEKHLDTIILLDGSPLCPRSEADHADTKICSDSNITTLSNLIYFSLLLPHAYAKIAMMETFATILVDCGTLNSRKHSKQKQHVMGSVLQHIFPSNSDGSGDVVSVFSVVLVLLKSIRGNDEQEELSRASESLQLRLASAEIFRCLWRLGLSASSPLVSIAPVMLSSVHERHIHPLCTRLCAVYQQHGHHLLASTQPPSGEMLVQLQATSVEALQLQLQLVSLLHYLAVFVEDTVEHFSLDEDEEDEEDEEEGNSGGRGVPPAGQSCVLNYSWQFVVLLLLKLNIHIYTILIIRLPSIAATSYTDKSYDLSFTLYFREWLSILAALTNQLHSLRHELACCQDLTLARGCPSPLPDLIDVLLAYGKLWESCPHVLKAVDPFLISYTPEGCATSVPSSVAAQDSPLGSMHDVQVYAHLMPGTWDLLQHALSLSSLGHSHADPSRISSPPTIESIVIAFQRIAESCKYASSASASQLLACLQLFVQKEDELHHQQIISFASSSPTSSSLMSSTGTGTGGSQYYRMMASYLRLIGLDGRSQHTAKENALQVVFQSIIGPLEAIFTQISQASCADAGQQSRQLEVLSYHSNYLLMLFSRLKGFIYPLSEDQEFSMYVLKLHEFLFNMLRVISELYVFAFSSSEAQGQGVSGVLHLVSPNEEDVSSEVGGGGGQEIFAALHDGLVGVLCSVLDTPLCPAALARNTIKHLGQILSKLQSSKLIRLVTVVTRWSVGASIPSTVEDEGDASQQQHLQQVGQAVAMIMCQCRLELDAVLAQHQCGQDMTVEWLGHELAMIWRLSRQVCSSFPPLQVHSYHHTYEGGGGGGDSDTVLSQLMALCVSVVKSATSLSTHRDLVLSLHLRPLCTMFDLLRSRAWPACQGQSPEGQGGQGAAAGMDNTFVALFLPAAQEILALLLSFILYGDAIQDGFQRDASCTSHKDLKQLFGQVYLLLLDVLGMTTLSGVEATAEVLEAVYWPFCSYVFHSSPCTDMTLRVMTAHQISAESLPSLPTDTDTEMSNGVFLTASPGSGAAGSGAGAGTSGVETRGELQYVSAKTATATAAEVFLQHGKARARTATQRVRNTVNALCEIEATFKFLL